jgi:pseudaminic acid cytidylyltransferase
VNHLCVIPARGGSKRIPRKNLRVFAGRPIISHSSAAARACGCFAHVIVSTDDAEIAEVARTEGATVPFSRPPELADDHAGTIPVIAHALAWMRDHHGDFDAVCCLYPTAPFVDPSDLREGLRLLQEADWSYVFTAGAYAAPIFRAFQQAPSGGVEMYFPDRFATRSQDLPQALHDAGQFYWGRPRAWLSGEPFFTLRSRPLLLPRWRIQDIDTPEDWIRAELMYPIVRDWIKGTCCQP